MSTNTFETKFQNIIDANFELVSQYNEIDSNIPLEFSFEDVLDAYNSYKAVNRGAEFVHTIKTALFNAVRYEQSILDALTSMTTEALQESPSNSIQQYFKEVGDIYDRHNNDYNIEFCPENRDKLIEMNLKTVVSIAKKYQGLGLSLNELISAGNLGLVIAYDKFDPSRSRLKDNILSSVSELECEFSYDELLDVVKDHMSYGDIKKKFCDRFFPNKSYTKKEVIQWVNKNIFNGGIETWHFFRAQ